MKERVATNALLIISAPMIPRVWRAILRVTVAPEKERITASNVQRSPSKIEAHSYNYERYEGRINLRICSLVFIKGHIRTILSGNTCINLHRDLPSPSRLQLYLIGIHVVCLLLMTYASYIYKGNIKSSQDSHPRT